MADRPTTKQSSKNFAALILLLGGAAGIIVFVTACVSGLTTQDVSKRALKRAVSIRTNDTLTSVLDQPHKRHSDFLSQNNRSNFLRTTNKFLRHTEEKRGINMTFFTTSNNSNLSTSLQDLNSS